MVYPSWLVGEDVNSDNAAEGVGNKMHSTPTSEFRIVDAPEMVDAVSFMDDGRDHFIMISSRHIIGNVEHDVRNDIPDYFESARSDVLERELIDSDIRSRVSIPFIFERKRQTPVDLSLISRRFSSNSGQSLTGSTIMPPISSLRLPLIILFISSAFTSRRNALIACVK